MTAPAAPDLADRSPGRTAGPAASTAGSPGAAAGQPTSFADGWRKWRLAALIVAVVLTGGIVTGLLQAGAPAASDLDPASTAPDGTHALAAILAARGTTVTRTVTVAATQAAARPGRTLVVTSPWLIPAGQLKLLARLPGNLVLVRPDRAALAALAPAVTLGGTSPVQLAPPRCVLPVAFHAGPAELGGQQLRASLPGIATCYPVNGTPSLVSYSDRSRTITVLGTGVPLTNASLAGQGNAALALNLLGTGPGVVWLLPGPGLAAALPGQPRSLTSLIPWPAYLIVIQLAIAAVLTALWRGRRLGPLVPEPLPVVVRAAETVEGHARLYQARRARDQAARALRAAAAGRLAGLLGLPAGSGPDALAQAISARTGRPAAGIGAVLSGPAPADDRALTALASQLDAVEREAGTQ
ncbi:MAG TPA: DUF4350 domain-containing protein [Streptosporangiaceae bacterium]|jgi:hypothetical protein